MLRPDKLSKREKEVVALLMQGKSNKQIALALGISQSTVEFHLKNVYAKLQVSSRVEAILILWKSTGDPLAEKPGKSIVDGRSGSADNGDAPVRQTPWALSRIGGVTEMKRRWLSYFLAGLVFGATYWHYLGATARLFNNVDLVAETWFLLPLALLTYFGVWLVPAILPAVFELRRSKNLRLSVLAVVVVWVSAVLGYYLNYIVMLAFFGLPHMEYLVVLGERTATLWQDWGVIFPKLILFKLLKWTVVGVIGGGLAGLTSGWIYSSLAKRNGNLSPA